MPAAKRRGRCPVCALWVNIPGAQQVMPQHRRTDESWCVGQGRKPEETKGPGW